MSVSLQADPALQRGYILVDGQRAATVTTAGLSGLVDNSVTSEKIVNGAVNNDKLSLAANAGEVKKALNADNDPPIFACRAWALFETSSTPPTISGGGNIALITRTSTGVFSVTFTTNMPAANYSVVGAGDSFGSAVTLGVDTKTTSGFRLLFFNATGALVNPQSANVAIFR